MPVYDVKVTTSEEVAEGTMAFHFEKPSNCSFTAGQFISVSLIDSPETDAEGDVRAFSIASAPYERDLLIATRMRDTAFKRIPRKSKPGELIRIRSPFGSLTLFMMMLSDLLRSLPAALAPAHRLFLFYSNRRVEDAAFLDDLRQCERTNPNFKCIATLTEPAQSKRQWDGEMGYVNKTTLLKFIHDLQEPIYYIAGPPGMVVSMQGELIAAGVTSDHIRAEQFAGY